MKISRYPSSKKCTFKDVDWGDVIEWNGEFFMRIQRFGDFNAVHLKDGRPLFISFNEEVIPINGEFIVKEETK